MMNTNYSLLNETERAIYLRLVNYMGSATINDTNEQLSKILRVTLWKVKSLLDRTRNMGLINSVKKTKPLPNGKYENRKELTLPKRIREALQEDPEFKDIKGQVQSALDKYRNKKKA